MTPGAGRRRFGAWRSRPPSSGMKLMSWNINGILDDDKAVYALRRLPSYAHVDIIALQEIRVSAPSGSASGHITCPPGWVESVAWGNGHAGVLVRARESPDIVITPLADPNAAGQEAAPFPALCRRVAALRIDHVRLKTSTFVISVYAPHTFTPLPDRIDFITQLTGWLQSLLPSAVEPSPPRVIIAGDLNTVFSPLDSSNPNRAPTAPEVLDSWATLAQELRVSDVWARGAPNHATGFTFRNQEHASRLDTVLATESLPARLALGPWGGGLGAAQDHRPIFTVFPTLRSHRVDARPHRFPLPRLSPFWWRDDAFARAADGVVAALLHEGPPPLLEDGSPNPRAAIWLLDWQDKRCFPQRARALLMRLHRRLLRERSQHLRRLDELAAATHDAEFDVDDPLGPPPGEAAADAPPEFSSLRAADDSRKPAYLLQILNREAVSKDITRQLVTTVTRDVTPSSPLRRADGSLAHTPTEKAQCAQEYFETLDKRRTSVVNVALQRYWLRSLLGPLQPTAPLAALGAPLTLEDIADALGVTTPDAEGRLTPPPSESRASRGKAPGPDGLPLEVYQAGGLAMAERLLAAYQYLGANAARARQLRFSEGIVILLHKKGDPADMGNWRPITLLNTAYKVLSKAMANKLGPALGQTIPALQTGFLPGRSIGTNIRTVQAHDALATAQQRSVFAVFLDFEKAFDTVSRDLIWTSLQLFGAPPGYVSFLRSTLFAHTESRTAIEGALSPAFSSSAGVRQGCCLSPYLFVVAGECMRRFLVSRFGPHLNPSRGASLNPAGWSPDSARTDWAVQYADDTALLINNVNALPSLMSTMDDFYKLSGLRVNRSKTLVWAAGAQSPQSIDQARLVTNRLKLSLVDSERTPLIYLGVDPRALSDDAAMRYWAPLVGRVRAAIATLVRLPPSLQHGVSMLGRVRLALAYALSRVLYHAEYTGIPRPACQQIQNLLNAYVERNAISSMVKGGFDGRFRVLKEVIYSPISYGGLGVPDVQILVAALHSRDIGALVDFTEPRVSLAWGAAMRAALDADRGNPTRARGLVGLLLGTSKPPKQADIPPQLRPLIRSGRVLAQHGLRLHPDSANMLAADLPALLSQPFADHPLLRADGSEPIGFNSSVPLHCSTPLLKESWFLTRPRTLPSINDGLLRHAAPILCCGPDPPADHPASAYLGWLDRRAWGLGTLKDPLAIRDAYLSREPTRGISTRQLQRLRSALPASWLARILAEGNRAYDPSAPPVPRADPTLTLGPFLGWLPRPPDHDPDEEAVQAPDPPSSDPTGFVTLQSARIRDVHRRFMHRGDRTRLRNSLATLRGPPVRTGAFVSRLARLSRRPHLPYAFDVVWKAAWRALPPDMVTTNPETQERIRRRCEHCGATDSSVHALWRCPFYAPIRAAFSQWAGCGLRQLRDTHIFGLQPPHSGWTRHAWELAASTYLRVAYRLYGVRRRLRANKLGDISLKTFFSRLGRNLTFAARVAAAFRKAVHGFDRDVDLFFGRSPGFSFDASGTPRSVPFDAFLAAAPPVASPSP